METEVFWLNKCFIITSQNMSSLTLILKYLHVYNRIQHCRTECTWHYYHWTVCQVSACAQSLESDILFCDCWPYTFWIVPIHTTQCTFLRKHTELLPATVSTPFCWGWCRGEEEARAFKKEVHSRLFSLHCWVMILHRPHGQHAASRRVCACAPVCVCETGWCVRMREKRCQWYPGEEGVGVLWMIFVCPWQLCVFVSKVRQLLGGRRECGCVCAAASGASLTCSYSTCHQPSVVLKQHGLFFHPADNNRQFYIFKLSLFLALIVAFILKTPS